MGRSAGAATAAERFRDRGALFGRQKGTARKRMGDRRNGPRAQKHRQDQRLPCTQAVRDQFAALLHDSGPGRRTIGSGARG